MTALSENIKTAQAIPVIIEEEEEDLVPTVTSEGEAEEEGGVSHGGQTTQKARHGLGRLGHHRLFVLLLGSSYGRFQLVARVVESVAVVVLAGACL